MVPLPSLCPPGAFFAHSLPNGNNRIVPFVDQQQPLLLPPSGHFSALLPSDWDLASIESSLSPDPCLDDLLSSTSGCSPKLELELDPLQFSQDLSAYYNQCQQHEHCLNGTDERVPFSSLTVTADFHSPEMYDQQNLLALQARRNAQIAFRMSPYRKLQERLQAVQRRQTQQKTKRKFSLKNGPSEFGTKAEAGRIRGTLNSSVRRWRTEMGAMIFGRKGRQAQKEMRRL